MAIQEKVTQNTVSTWKNLLFSWGGGEENDCCNEEAQHQYDTQHAEHEEYESPPSSYQGNSTDASSYGPHNQPDIILTRCHEIVHAELVLWDNPEGRDGEGGGRGVQDGGHTYTPG